LKTKKCLHSVLDKRKLQTNSTSQQLQGNGEELNGTNCASKLWSKNGLHMHGGPSEGKMQYIVGHRDNLLGTYLWHYINSTATTLQAKQ
jgi:hypothetical protein